MAGWYIGYAAGGLVPLDEAGGTRNVALDLCLDAAANDAYFEPDNYFPPQDMTDAKACSWLQAMIEFMSQLTL